MKLKLKIFKKYFFLTVTIIVLSLFFMATLVGFIISNYLVKEKRHSLTECCNSVSLIAAKGDFKTISDIIPVAANAIDADIFITDINGKPIYCSCAIYKEYKSCEHTKNNIPNRIVNTTLSEDEFYEVGNFDGNLETSNYIYGKRLTDNNGNNFAVIYAVSRSASIGYFFMSILRLLIMASIVTVVLMFFAVYYVSYRLTKPLRLMSEAARCMAYGDFSKRIPITTDDEVGELAFAFNNMTDSLVKLESTRRSFVANVSHELKTPMTTIGGFIDGIIDGTIPPEKEIEYLRIVSDEIKRLSRLIQSMLSLSKLESGEMKVNFSEFTLSSVLIDIVIAQQQRIESKNIKITGLDSLSQANIKADKDLIHQVVYNLTDNAIKFTLDGGEINFKIFAETNETRFIIKNYGIGIESKDLPHVFDRFYKIDKSRSAVKESTGLGLYIAKTIIDIHRGHITVRSKNNEYTEFEFSLPNIKEEI